jgi:hypothetical protein
MPDSVLPFFFHYSTSVPMNKVFARRRLQEQKETAEQNEKKKEIYPSFF